MIRRIQRPFPSRSAPELFSGALVSVCFYFIPFRDLMKHIAFVEGPLHLSLPPTNSRIPFRVTPQSPTSPLIDSPTTSIKKPASRNSLSNKGIELNHRGPTPRVALSNENDQLHRQNTPRHSHSHQLHNDDHTMLTSSPSISQSLNSSAVATVTTSSSGSTDGSHLRQAIALDELEHKKASSNFDLLHPLAISLSLPRDEHISSPDSSLYSTRLQSTSRRPQPPPGNGDLPPAYDTFRN